MSIERPTEQDKVLVNQLLEGIELGGLNEDTISEFKYDHLRALLRYMQLLDGGQEFYIKIKQQLEKIALNKIRKKNKIRVGFVVSGVPVWCEDELYQLLEESDLFEPYIYVFIHSIGQSVEMMLDEYEEHIEYFHNKGMRVVETIDIEKMMVCSWEDIGGFPDICIWTTPWMYSHQPLQRISEYPLSTIHAYIPYCFSIAANENNKYVYLQYNYEFHNLIWTIFEDSYFSLEMAEKYAFVKSTNAMFTGSPKMDAAYELTQQDPWVELCKKCGNNKAKRIIYAPHHTMEPAALLKFATFQDNYRKMLELAKRYEDDTIWLFKPHPALKVKAIQVGIFKDESEWDAYVQEWRELKNGMVYEGTEYHPYFQGSDAMILDCASFLVEYLFVNKPMLFLRREEQDFNEIGNMILPLIYEVDGKDIDGIAEFIQSVVIDGEDLKKEKREGLFEENFSYRNLTGKEQSASANIYDVLKSDFE